jgi:hypothetical protein
MSDPYPYPEESAADVSATRPFGIFSTMAHIDTQIYIDEKMSSIQRHSYIRCPTMGTSKKCRHL